MREKGIKNIFWTAICYIFFSYICLGGIIILEIHRYAPFSLILFLLELCFVIGYPLFLHFVLRKKWLECTKNSYNKVKYILFPALVTETCIMLYYHNQILLVLQKISEN